MDWPGLWNELKNAAGPFAVCVLLVYLFTRYVTRIHAEHLKTIEDQHKNHVLSIEKVWEKALAEKDKEIDRLTGYIDKIQAEKDALRKQVGEKTKGVP